MSIDFMSFIEVEEKPSSLQINSVNDASTQIEAVGKSVESLREKAEAFQIKNRNNAIVALEMAMQARKIKKAMEDTRMEITKPHLDFQKSIKKLADSYTSKLEDIEERMLEKLDGYRLESDDFEKIESEEGNLSVVSSHNFSVTDKSKVPMGYLQIDRKAVEKAIKGGIRNIEGLEIYHEEKLSCRVKN